MRTRSTRAGRASGLLCAAIILLAGCAGTSAPVESGAGDPLADVDLSVASETQAAEISDRLATAEEYHAAFERYRECLRDAGFELDGAEFTGLVYDFSLSNAAVEDGADGRCYLLEYKYTDML